MNYSEYSLLNPKSVRIERSFQQLEKLRRVNGGYFASLNSGKPDGTGRYNVFWLRDIMYATYANEYLGNMNQMMQSYELVMSIMMKYKAKLCAAIRKKPEAGHWALHARFHPNTLEEITPDWGHHQIDVLGLFLYKTGDLIKKGHNVIRTAEQRELVMNVIQYLFTFRWETEPDFGVWEEGPELHASSIGAVLAGLTMWFDSGHYHHKYQLSTDLSQIVPVSERYFDNGSGALNNILPRESVSRESDFAQLSLIWPYNIVSEEMSNTIINNVEKKLVRKHGVIRYKGDYYFNSNPAYREGHEAQWPLGLAWLAIAHNKMASRIASKNKNLKLALSHLQKSKEYLLTIDKIMVGDSIPELYVGEEPNENCPFAWAHSFHIIALQSFLNTLEVIRKEFNAEINEDLEPIYVKK